MKRPVPSRAAADIAPLVAAMGELSGLRTHAIDLAAYASDASHFLLTPQAVVVAADAKEVSAVFRAATGAGSGVTLRSGGTSLSGQASGEGVLVDVRQRFRDIEVLDNGRRVRVQPGATIRQVNMKLARSGYRLGPDPASEAACTVGGVIANNSSGMSCGTDTNTYRTLESAVIVLPSGTVVDTSASDADAQLRQREPELVDGLLRLRRRVRTNPESVEIIRRHFALKNTMGYGVNAFLDHDTPTDLLLHLVVGSEGTLAFVAEATFRTVPVKPRIASTLAIFPTIDAATRSLPALVETGAATIELMDATSLRVGQSLPNAPAQIRGFEVTTHASLLVEYTADSQDELSAMTAGGLAVLADCPLRTPAELSDNAAARSAAWSFRKGLYASVAGARPAGTTALLEDIAVPVGSLAPTCQSLQALLHRFGYPDGAIFGHAKDGNIHFLLTDRFEGDAAIRRYEDFTESMVDLVLAAGGNLKAEHGTGRAMAPYVRRQYGDELYDVMREIKQLCDPAGVLNPGVIIDDDSNGHLRNIKPAPAIDEEVDRCVECGYCEPVCPSRDLTLTPRQRIAVRRAVASATARGDHVLAAELDRQYDYAGVQTCAVDGMCQTACPVHIDTGSLVKRLRREQANPARAAVWGFTAKAWGAVTRTCAAGLEVADAVPIGLMQAVTDGARAVLGADAIPRYTTDLPKGGTSRRSLAAEVGAGTDDPIAVYLPACVNSMFGPHGHGAGVTGAFVRLLDRAGVRMTVPRGIESICCGMPWSSKGFVRGYRTMAKRLVARVSTASREGELPIVSDAASCTEGFAKILVEEGMRVEDAITFAVRELLPRLTIEHTVSSLALHPTCSSHRLGIDPDLFAVGGAVAATLHVPDAWGCCAFAGDRGMLHPELTAAATAPEAAEVRALGAEAHASCNRTCEIGMTRATGKNYQHVIELLESATRRPGYVDET